MADAAEEPTNGNGNGNGTNGKVRVAVLTWLGVSLTIFAVGLVTIGVTSLIQPAADPAGVNAVREDLKSFVLFVLGALTGVLVPHGTGKG